MTIESEFGPAALTEDVFSQPERDEPKTGIDFDVEITAAMVADYRGELDDCWGIRPALWGYEIDARLNSTERREWHRFMRQLATNDDSSAVRFYEWLSTSGRVAAIHSYKWAEILVSGIWAASVVNALQPEHTLDLGCNVGYWTSWTAKRHRVHGIDRSKPAIALAQSRAAELGRNASFSVQDFCDDFVAEPVFDCVVSLQGLQHEFVKGNFAALEHVARHLRPGGHLVLVEGGLRAIEGAAAFDASLHAAGLTPLALTDCGGLGLGEKTFRYLGLVAIENDKRSGSIEPFFDMKHWGRFVSWGQPRRWDQANTAYYGASGAPTLRDAA